MFSFLDLGALCPVFVANDHWKQATDLSPVPFVGRLQRFVCPVTGETFTALLIAAVLLAKGLSMNLPEDTGKLPAARKCRDVAQNVFEIVAG